MGRLTGFTIVPTEWVAEINRETIRRPWYQRWLAWAWQPWKKPLVRETLPWYQIGDMLYAHPKNIERLEQALAAAEAARETND